ncbi:MAG TPA: hypothetical protein ENK09_09855 [Nitrospirae bacterium]|nr:hypothetical protein [Nitrospirota bacterium]
MRCPALTGICFEQIRFQMKVNYDRIQEAMEDVKRDIHDYYLDLSTGEIITVPVAEINRILNVLYMEDDDDPDSAEVLFDSAINMEFQPTEKDEAAIDLMLRVIEEGERYIRIPERPSSHAYRVMKSFALTVYDTSLREALLRALDGPGAFRRFKDLLKRDKKQRKRWHSYNAHEMRRFIEGWLRQRGIDP